MSLSNFPTFAERLREALRRSLPGTEAQLTMAPAYRMDPEQAQVEGKNCREAAVLALVFPMEKGSHAGEPGLILTVRPEHLPDHPGQISFPGGQREPDEQLSETALREAHEEIGLDPSGVELIGSLTPLYIPPSGFCVYPFVGVSATPPELRPTDAEVGALLRVPLARLLDPETLQREEWPLRGTRVEVPFFALDTYRVWGATAMIIAEFLELVRTRMADSISSTSTSGTILSGD